MGSAPVVRQQTVSRLALQRLSPPEFNNCVGKRKCLCLFDVPEIIINSKISVIRVNYS